MNKNNKTYILSVNSTQMKEMGFKYDYGIQDYIYKFPVYKSKKFNSPLIFCKLGVDEETAYEDSCKIEHDISEISFEKIKEFLNRQ